MVPLFSSFFFAVSVVHRHATHPFISSYGDLLRQVHKVSFYRKCCEVGALFLKASHPNPNQAAGLHYSLAGVTPAQSAARNAVDELRYMTDYGDPSNLHAPGNDGRTPFCCALAADHIEAARFLCDLYVEREAARFKSNRRAAGVDVDEFESDDATADGTLGSSTMGALSPWSRSEVPEKSVPIHGCEQRRVGES